MSVFFFFLMKFSGVRLRHQLGKKQSPHWSGKVFSGTGSPRAPCHWVGINDQVSGE